MTDKNRKWIYKPNRIVMLLLYLLLPTAAYLSAVLYLYNSEKHNIESEANRFLMSEATPLFLTIFNNRLVPILRLQRVAELPRPSGTPSYPRGRVLLIKFNGLKS